MPNTGQLLGQAFKCNSCRKNFKDVWMPSNVCCRIAAMEAEKTAALNRMVNLYSRYLTEDAKEASNLRKSSKSLESSDRTSAETPAKLRNTPFQQLSNPRMKYVNSLAPFSTLGKSTCGYYFSRETDNKKRKTGIPPSNLVAWRAYITWLMRSRSWILNNQRTSVLCCWDLFLQRHKFEFPWKIII